MAKKKDRVNHVAKTELLARSAHLCEDGDVSVDYTDTGNIDVDSNTKTN